MSKIINVGFCGAGGIVRGNHKPNLEARSDRYRIIGFYDVVSENAKKMAGTAYKAYPSYEEMLADAAIDLVVVATKPLATHFPAALAALRAGKDVLLEKPMASTSDECDRLMDAASKNKRLLTVHHNRRLDLDFLALRDYLAKGKIGQPILVVDSVCGGGYAPGDLVDWGVHLVDQALLINGTPLKEVTACTLNPAGGLEQGGYVEAVFRFEKPPVVRMDMLPRPKEFLINGTPPHARFAAYGTSGTILQRTIEDPRDLMNATVNTDSWTPDYAVPDYLSVQKKDYYDFLYDYYAGKGALLVKPEEARNAIRALELMAESARLGATVPATNML